MMQLSVSVLIPTYRRPHALFDCVQSLVECSPRPNEIIIVGREGDVETEQAIHRLVSRFHSLISIWAEWVTTPGHIPPIEAGIRRVAGDVVAIVDDDVTVCPDWLGYLVGDFNNKPEIGVVGGRVVVPGASPTILKGKPGRISWYGKFWGNIGSVEGSEPSEVDGVMECNWAWRRGLLGTVQFDPHLNFDDAAMYGLDLCLQAREKGFQVLYDPRALVYHHVAPRAPGLNRTDRSKRDFSYNRNYTYIVLKRLPRWQIPIFISWWFLIGERGAWGLGAILADSILAGWHKDRHVIHSLRGKLEGIRLWLKQ